MTDSKSQTKQTVLLIKMYDDIYKKKSILHLMFKSLIRVYLIIIDLLDGCPRLLQMDVYA